MHAFQVQSAIQWFHYKTVFRLCIYKTPAVYLSVYWVTFGDNASLASHQVLDTGIEVHDYTVVSKATKFSSMNIVADLIRRETQKTFTQEVGRLIQRCMVGYCTFYCIPGNIQAYILQEFSSTRVPDAAYQLSRSSAVQFWRRRVFKVFVIYGHDGHLGHVTKTVWRNFRSPQPTEPPYTIWLQLVQWLLRRRCLKRWQTDDVRQMPTYTISSPMSLRLRWAKKGSYKGTLVCQKQKNK